MKNMFPVASLMLFGLLGMQNAVAYGASQEIALAHVNCTVEPTVTIASYASGEDLTVGSAIVSGTYTFRIDANVDHLNIMVSASNLYKAGDVNSEVLPILVYKPAGIAVYPSQGAGAVLPYDSSHSINGFPAEKTAMRIFESSQNGRFSQDVDVKVSWDQNDPRKPQGHYIGFVHLFAMVL